jgi:hypothetical protein
MTKEASHRSRYAETHGATEPLYEKWIDTARLLKDHLLLLAEKGDELAIQGLKKFKEWESQNNMKYA